jgi:ribonuclease P protein component
VSLPKIHRLRARKDFAQVFRKGIYARSDRLILRAISSPLPAPSQLGVTISKKVSKKAVVRNRIKRFIKRAFRELLPTINPNWKIVVVVLPTAKECQYEFFLRQLEQLLTKVEIIHGH